MYTGLRKFFREMFSRMNIIQVIISTRKNNVVLQKIKPY